MSSLATLRKGPRPMQLKPHVNSIQHSGQQPISLGFSSAFNYGKSTTRQLISRRRSQPDFSFLLAFKPHPPSHRRSNAITFRRQSFVTCGNSKSSCLSFTTWASRVAADRPLLSLRRLRTVCAAESRSHDSRRVLSPDRRNRYHRSSIRLSSHIQRFSPSFRFLHSCGLRFQASQQRNLRLCCLEEAAGGFYTPAFQSAASLVTL